MRLIDADALFERAFEIWGIEADASDTNVFMQAINDAPTVDAAPIIHARWKWPEEPPHIKGTVCTNCGQPTFVLGNYCPNCGAKMDFEE